MDAITFLKYKTLIPSENAWPQHESGIHIALYENDMAGATHEAKFCTYKSKDPAATAVLRVVRDAKFKFY